MITTTSARRLARGAAVLSAPALALALALAVAVALPASADVPQGWSDPDPVSWLTILWMLIGIPVGLSLLIALAVYAPALARGEKLTPGEPKVEDQWFGGPRRGTQELAAPDIEESKAGSASGRW